MFYDMTPQPIQNRRSADSSPVLTPSGSPHWIEGKMQHFFAAFEGPNGGGLGRGWQSDDNEALRQGRQGGGNGNASAGPSRAQSFSIPAAQRPSVPFFSNLSLSRPQPSTAAPARGLSQSVGMSKTPSLSGSSDVSTSSNTFIPSATSSSSAAIRDPKRASTLPVGTAAILGMEKRHYDPSREPKLLHFM